MALSFASFKRMPPSKGGYTMGFCTVTFDNAYPTGGYSIAYTDLSLKNAILDLHCQPVVAGSNLGFVAAWDHSNGKLVVYESGTADAGLDELNSSSTALNSLTARIMYAGY